MEFGGLGTGGERPIRWGGRNETKGRKITGVTQTRQEALIALVDGHRVAEEVRPDCFCFTAVRLETSAFYPYTTSEIELL